MSCDLRERWSHCHGRTCHGRTKSTQLYIFCFLLVSVHSNTVWLFLICLKPFFPLLDHFWVLICIENPFVEYSIFTFKFLRFTYTIWFLKASNLDFITLNTNNLAKTLFFLVFYQYPSKLVFGRLGRLHNLNSGNRMKVIVTPWGKFGSCLKDDNHLST